MSSHPLANEKPAVTVRTHVEQVGDAGVIEPCSGAKSLFELAQYGFIDRALDQAPNHHRFEHDSSRPAELVGTDAQEGLSERVPTKCAKQAIAPDCTAKRRIGGIQPHPAIIASRDWTRSGLEMSGVEAHALR